MIFLKTNFLQVHQSNQCVREAHPPNKIVLSWRMFDQSGTDGVSSLWYIPNFRINGQAQYVIRPQPGQENVRPCDASAELEAFSVIDSPSTVFSPAVVLCDAIFSSTNFIQTLSAVTSNTPTRFGGAASKFIDDYRGASGALVHELFHVLSPECTPLFSLFYFCFFPPLSHRYVLKKATYYHDCGVARIMF